MNKYLNKVHVIHPVKMITRQNYYVVNILVLGVLQKKLKFRLIISTGFPFLWGLMLSTHLENPCKLSNSICSTLEPLFPCFPWRLSCSKNLVSMQNLHQVIRAYLFKKLTNTFPFYHFFSSMHTVWDCNISHSSCRRKFDTKRSKEMAIPPQIHLQNLHHYPNCKFQQGDG